jgi:hypothetical protein
MKKIRNILLFCVIIIVISAVFAVADEGMWTFDNPPLRQIKERYDFEPDQEWFNQLRLSACQVGGGSGSFISPNGLIATNHHVIRDFVRRLSTKDNNYLKNGFYAPAYTDEIKIPDSSIWVLVKIENVTEQINRSVSGLTGIEAEEALKQEIDRLEKETTQKTGLFPLVISLYNGSQHWLYCYKSYEDIRLVFVPEDSVGNFSSLPATFVYPSYAMDFAFIRAYENEKPVKTENHLKVSRTPVRENELTFAIGNPTDTFRNLTYAELLLEQEMKPFHIGYVLLLTELYQAYTGSDPVIIGRRNSIGHLEQTLKNELSIMSCRDYQDQKRSKELAVLEIIGQNPGLKETIGNPWKNIELFIQNNRHEFIKSRALRRTAAITGDADFIIKLAESNGEELSPRTAWRKKQLLKDNPVNLDLNEIMANAVLSDALNNLGPDDKYVKILLGGKSPVERAKELVRETKLNDRDYREHLINGGMKVIEKSQDPVIRLSLELREMNQEMTSFNQAYNNLLRNEHNKIMRAITEFSNEDYYPDATGSIRFSYGTVKGFTKDSLEKPALTHFRGLFENAHSDDKNNDRYQLPEKFLRQKNNIDLNKSVNFATTAEGWIGSSGSPVVNRNRETIGMVYTGNDDAFSARYAYNPDGRTIAVSFEAIMEVLDKVYNAKELLREIWH